MAKKALKKEKAEEDDNLEGEEDIGENDDDEFEEGEDLSEEDTGDGE